MLQASESGLIIDPDRLEGKFEDFIGVYKRLVHHEICNTIISNFENYLNFITVCSNASFREKNEDYEIV